MPLVCVNKWVVFASPHILLSVLIHSKMPCSIWTLATMGLQPTLSWAVNNNMLLWWFIPLLHWALGTGHPVSHDLLSLETQFALCWVGIEIVCSPNTVTEEQISGVTSIFYTLSITHSSPPFPLSNRKIIHANMHHTKLPVNVMALAAGMTNSEQSIKRLDFSRV